MSEATIGEIKVKRIEQHYTVKQLAALLSCSKTTIYDAIKQGKTSRGTKGLTHVVYVGSSPRIPASSISRWCGAASFFAKISADA